MMVIMASDKRPAMKMSLDTVVKLLPNPVLLMISTTFLALLAQFRSAILSDRSSVLLMEAKFALKFSAVIRLVWDSSPQLNAELSTQLAHLSLLTFLDHRDLALRSLSVGKLPPPMVERQSLATLFRPVLLELVKLSAHSRSQLLLLISTTERTRRLV